MFSGRGMRGGVRISRAGLPRLPCVERSRARARVEATSVCLGQRLLAEDFLRATEGSFSEPNEEKATFPGHFRGVFPPFHLAGKPK